MKKISPISGGVTFSVIGAYTERFISELMDSGISVYDIKNKDNIIFISSRRTDYRKIAELARRNAVKIKVTDRHGLYFKIIKVKSRSGIIAGIALFSVIMIILQQFIWKIDIHGADSLSDNVILETVADNGIKIGSLIQNIDTKFAEIMLKSTLSSLSWVNIEQSGSRIDIYVRESDNPEKNVVSSDMPCNIIAAKTGIIVETQVYSGTLLYPVGSGVSKGNIIVSGIVNDGADNISLTHANAKIIAEYTETVEFRQDYTTIEKEKNGDAEIEKELMIFGFVIPITDKVVKAENKICNEQVENKTIFGMDMPWKIKTNTYYTYNDITVTRSSEDALKLAEQKLNIYCSNFYPECEIIDIRKSYIADDCGITIKADIKLKGNIVELQQIY